MRLLCLYGIWGAACNISTETEELLENGYKILEETVEKC